MNTEKEGIGFLLVFALLMGGVMTIAIQSHAEIQGQALTGTGQGTGTKQTILDGRVLGDSVSLNGRNNLLHSQSASDSLVTENTSADEPDAPVISSGSTAVTDTKPAAHSIALPAKPHRSPDEERTERGGDD